MDRLISLKSLDISASVVDERGLFEIYNYFKRCIKIDTGSGNTVCCGHRCFCYHRGRPDNRHSSACCDVKVHTNL